MGEASETKRRVKEENTRRVREESMFAAVCDMFLLFLFNVILIFFVFFLRQF